MIFFIASSILAATAFTQVAAGKTVLRGLASENCVERAKTGCTKSCELSGNCKGFPLAKTDDGAHNKACTQCIKGCIQDECGGGSMEFDRVAEAKRGSKASGSSSSKSSKVNEEYGWCKPHCKTTQEAQSCILAALGRDYYNPLNSDLSKITVDGCIYWGSQGIPPVSGKDPMDTVVAWRENNSLYQGTAMAGTLRSTPNADVPSYAFAWVKGSDHIEDIIKNLYNCTFIDQNNESDCIRDFLLRRQMQQSGFPPKFATGNIMQLALNDLCKLNLLDETNDARSDYTVGITPDVSNMARYIKSEYLQKKDYGKKSFKLGTIAALNPKLPTPPQNYAAALFEEGASCSVAFADRLSSGFSVMTEDDLKHVNDQGCHLKENAKLTVDAINAAGGTVGVNGAEACLDAYLSQDATVWDSPEALRVALDACFDTSPLCALTGQGWWPDIEYEGFATTEWLVPNTKTQNELVSASTFAELVVSCDGEVGPSEIATTTCQFNDV